MIRWNNKELSNFYVHKFDFDNQIKSTYTDWIIAFQNSIRKCASNGCFMGLSSGYDSGATSYEMSKQGIHFKAYTTLNGENEQVIKERLKYIPENAIIGMTQELYQQYYNFLKGKINPLILTDRGAPGVAHIFDTAKKEGRSIYISNQGSDEIISDYALSTYPGQSRFKGIFPDKLYEWPNFRSNVNLLYLKETEDIAKIYGIMVHYPYLDIDLVQEFLWLTPELKNKYYKAPLREYFTINNIPFEENVKRGFHPV